MDPVGRLIASLHNVLGHDKAAAYLGVPAGDKRDCLICAYEACPDDLARQRVIRALAPPATTP